VRPRSSPSSRRASTRSARSDRARSLPRTSLPRMSVALFVPSFAAIFVVSLVKSTASFFRSRRVSSPITSTSRAPTLRETTSTRTFSIPRRSTSAPSTASCSTKSSRSSWMVGSASTAPTPSSRWTQHRIRLREDDRIEQGHRLRCDGRAGLVDGVLPSRRGRLLRHPVWLVPVQPHGQWLAQLQRHAELLRRGDRLLRKPREEPASSDHDARWISHARGDQRARDVQGPQCDRRADGNLGRARIGGYRADRGIPSANMELHWRHVHAGGHVR
jgi:hypothetical protein